MIRKSWMTFRGALLLSALLLALPVHAAFTVNADGTVTDSATGLIWDQCSWGLSGTSCSMGSASTFTWPLALGVAVTANSASYKGRTDWRLPNRNELESLIDLSRASPAINTLAFPGTLVNTYWTSTIYPINPDRAGFANFGNGDTGAWFKTSGYYVRLVRGGPSFGSFDTLAPSSPFNVVAVMGNASAKVSFSGPGDNGAVVSGYTVRATPYGGGAGLRAVQRNSAAVTEPVAIDIDAGTLSLSHTVTGLVNGTAYTFSVTAHGSEGDSLASTESNAMTALSSFSDSRSNYSIVRSSSGFTLRDNVGANGSMALIGVSKIVFADATVNLLIGDLSKTIPADSLKTLIELYVAFFNRIPDSDGLAYWIGQFNSGMSLEQIADSFYQAAIAYSDLTGYTSSMSNADFVGIIYKNVLGRTGSTAPTMTEVNYWSDQITSGALSRADVIAVILVAAHSYKGDSTWGWVADLLDNKYSVATLFCLEQGLNYNTPEESITKGMAIAAAVTPTSIAAALALIEVTDAGFNLTLP